MTLAGGGTFILRFVQSVSIWSLNVIQADHHKVSSALCAFPPKLLGVLIPAAIISAKYGEDDGPGGLSCLVRKWKTYGVRQSGNVEVLV